MKILIAGDFCPQYRVAERFEKEDYSFVLGAIKPTIEEVDYSIVNLECPVTKGSEKPIVKQGSNLKCTKKAIDALKWCGFDCVTLANNHFLDYGEEGVANTLEACTEVGIDVVGGGMSLQESSRVLYRDINGKMLAIINCCEHEFSIATDKTAGSNPLNPIQQYYAIEGAREKADYVLVIVHGGNEHYQLPSPRMQETYRFFIDAGADAVVNHHQHCYSGYEIYNEKPIFYGLGNFCFDKNKKRNIEWHEGYVLILQFDQSNVGFSMIPYNQCSEDATIIKTDETSFDGCIKKLNAIISDRSQLSEMFKRYNMQKLRSTNLILEPLTNRYGRALQQRGFLPKFFYSEKYVLRLYNVIKCEAHKDKIDFYLDYLLKSKK